MLAASFIRSRAPFGAGLFLLTLSAAVRAESVPESSAKLPVDFERHIIGLFGKSGCNSGSCHGSFQGKNGFRLSLFGYDPEKDYYSLTREIQGRRIDPVDPDNSLLLAKATGRVAHEGGRRFAGDSWQYKALRAWIAGGAHWRKGSGEVVKLNVIPSELTFTSANQSRPLAVRAHFADGAEEDITTLCEFRTNDDAVAESNSQGMVKSLRPGDTCIVVSYRGNVIPVRVMVPVPAPPGFKYPQVPANNFIDRAVFAKLERLNIIPSELSSDTEFLRRVTIDTIGCLPTPDEVRAFLADDNPDKRAAKIDELLAHPMHAALWATKFSDITGNNTDSLELPREKRSKMWHDWLRKRFAANAAYDEIVRGILCSTSRDGKSIEDWIKSAKSIEEDAQKGFVTAYAERDSLDLFWRRQQRNVPLEQVGEKTAAAFMGIRLECAQCHKHPFDRWTQTDYRAHANIFGQIRSDVSPEAKQAVQDLNNEWKEKQNGKNRNQQIPPMREVYIAKGRPLALADPDTNRPLKPKALGGPQIPIVDGEDARVIFFEWLRRPDNPYFARSFVNRVWAHYFGIGIVEPFDDFSLSNPPSNPELLNALAKEFVDHQFDIRHIERVVLNSRTYQLASAPNETNRLDRNNFSHSQLRRMMAEVVVDVLNSALGMPESWGRSNDIPAGIRAVEMAPSRIQNGNLAYVFRIFGRSPRSQACDCERAMDPALPQKLFTMTDQTLMQKIRQGRLSELLKSGKDDEAIVEELFLATLNRSPNADEKAHFADYRKRNKDRTGVFVDTVWALINTREFMLNH